MANQDELSGDESRDLIDDRQHAVDLEDDMDDFNTQFNLINQQLNSMANPSYQQHVNRR